MLLAWVRLCFALNNYTDKVHCNNPLTGSAIEHIYYSARHMRQQTATYSWLEQTRKPLHLLRDNYYSILVHSFSYNLLVWAGFHCLIYAGRLERNIFTLGYDLVNQKQESTQLDILCLKVLYLAYSRNLAFSSK